MKRSNLATLWFLEENESERKKLENKTVFESKILIRVCLATNFFTTRNFLNGDFYNSPDFKSKYLLRVEYWIEFQHSVELWSTIFALHQILKEKTFLKKSKFVGKSALKESFIWPFYTVKMSKVAFSCIFKNLILNMLFLFKKIFAKQNTWKESDFELVFNNASEFKSRISKYVRLLVNSTQLVIFWIGIFLLRRILKHPFYHTSDFEQIFWRRNRLSRETGFEKWIFLGQFAFKKSFNKTCQN